ncbi:hypothetical protein BJ085DRAFT_32890, partial [Dimargaris cristalligena]
MSVTDEYAPVIGAPEQQSLLRRKWYKRKRVWFGCAAFTICAVLLIVLLVIFVGVKNIIQGTIDDSSMTFRNLQIHTPQNGTLGLDVNIALENTGSHKADLTFVEPVQIWWRDQMLGTMNLDPVTVDDDNGEVVQSQEFQLANQTVFGQFVGALLSAEEFEWDIKGKLRVHAVGFTRNDIELSKSIKIPGMNGLSGLEIVQFDLPGDDPEGGIKVALTMNLNNPSPFGIDLGHLRMEMYYNNTYVGPIESTNAVLTSGSSVMNLTGRLVPQTNATDLDNMGVLMSKFLGGEQIIVDARGISAWPDGENNVNWLAPAIRALHLNVPLAMVEKIDIINDIHIEDMDLDFTPETAYAPRMSSQRVDTGVRLPFNFTLDIQGVSQSLNITGANNTIASINVKDAPILENKVSSDGLLVFSIPETDLTVVDGMDSIFDKFVQNILLSKDADLGISGAAEIRANTPVGNLTLTNVPFNVNSTLVGMQGLTSSPLVIEGLDVTDGKPDQGGLQLGIKETTVGQVAMSNLTLQRNVTHATALATFDPSASEDGKDMLARFITGEASDVVIAGTAKSSAVDSLNPGLSQIRMPATIPGLNVTLIPQTRLTVLDDTASTGVARGGFTVVDPFGADLSITKIDAKLSVGGTSL